MKNEISNFFAPQCTLIAHRDFRRMSKIASCCCRHQRCPQRTFSSARNFHYYSTVGPYAYSVARIEIPHPRVRQGLRSIHRLDWIGLGGMTVFLISNHCNTVNAVSFKVRFMNLVIQVYHN